jgi:hypothetical protein
MLFSNFDPYYNDEISYNRLNPEEDCFICYAQHGELPIQLDDQEYYVKKCRCLGIVHKSCLDIWYNKSSKCPVCREFIVKKGTLYSSLPYSITYYLLYERGIKILARTISMIIFSYCLLEFYYSILNTIFIDESEYYEY